MPTLSKSERGRSAERMPTGIAIMSQTITPPRTSEAVTGAPWAIMVRTSWRVYVEVPRYPCVTIRERNWPYCW